MDETRTGNAVAAPSVHRLIVSPTKRLHGPPEAQPPAHRKPSDAVPSGERVVPPT
jgi:hypothetical protein